MRIAICNELLQEKYSFEETCEIVAGIGYKGIEIAPFTLAPDIRELSGAERQETVDICKKYGLTISALHWLLVSPPGLHIATPDPVTYNRTREFFRGLIDFAADVGAEFLVFGSPQQRNIAPEWDVVCCRNQVVNFFQEMGGYAATKDIMIAFEPLDPAMTNLGASAGESLDLVQQIGQPNVKVHLDVKAMSAEPHPIPEIIRQVGLTNLAYFHANDPNGLGPGMGDLDFLPIRDALISIGYTGWISVEAFEKTVDPEEIAQQSYDYLVEKGF